MFCKLILMSGITRHKKAASLQGRLLVYYKKPKLLPRF
jgi:hypothetical protein